jgi:hypothetical protein
MTLRELKQMQAARRQTSYRDVTRSFKESQISPSNRVRKQELRRATNQVIAIVVGALIVAVVTVGITLLIVG